MPGITRSSSASRTAASSSVVSRVTPGRRRGGFQRGSAPAGVRSPGRTSRTGGCGGNGELSPARSSSGMRAGGTAHRLGCPREPLLGRLGGGRSRRRRGRARRPRRGVARTRRLGRRARGRRTSAERVRLATRAGHRRVRHGRPGARRRGRRRCGGPRRVPPPPPVDPGRTRLARPRARSRRVHPGARREQASGRRSRSGPSPRSRPRSASGSCS